MVKIANKLPDNWIIDLVGGGDRKEIRRLNELISEEGVGEKLILHGSKNTDELKNYYENSSIFLSTSRWEGFGLVLLEAMSFGLPVVSFKQSGSIDILDNGKYGILVDNGDLEQLGVALNKVIESPSIQKNMQKLSLERVIDYSPDKIEQEWEKLMNKS